MGHRRPADSRHPVGNDRPRRPVPDQSNSALRMVARRSDESRRASPSRYLIAAIRRRKSRSASYPRMSPSRSRPAAGHGNRDRWRHRPAGRRRRWCSLTASASTRKDRRPPTPMGRFEMALAEDEYTFSVGAKDRVCVALTDRECLAGTKVELPPFTLSKRRIHLRAGRQCEDRQGHRLD